LEDREVPALKTARYSGVNVYPIEDGISTLHLIGPTLEVEGIKHHLTQVAQHRKNLARQEREAGNTDARVRTTGECEHETAFELPTGTPDHETYKHIAGQVNITIPALSLLTGSSRHSFEDMAWFLTDLREVLEAEQLAQATL